MTAHSHQQQLTWKELRGSSPVVLIPRMAKGVEKYESTAVAHDQKLKQQAEARFLARQYEMRQMRQQVGSRQGKGFSVLACFHCQVFHCQGVEAVPDSISE